MLKWFSRLFGRKKSPEITAKRESLERLMKVHQRRLQKLKEQQASPQTDAVPPHITIEIEDIEAKVQQLQTQLANDSLDRNHQEALLAAHQRRLEALKKMGIRYKTDNYGQEIAEIEAQLRQLQLELEKLER
jgi:hypothetical protein